MSVKELNQLSNKILRELNAMQLEQAEKDYVLFWKILRDDDLVKERQRLFRNMELRNRFAVWDRAKRDSTILSWARSLEAASSRERVERVQEKIREVSEKDYQYSDETINTLDRIGTCNRLVQYLTSMPNNAARIAENVVRDRAQYSMATRPVRDRLQDLAQEIHKLYLKLLYADTFGIENPYDRIKELKNDGDALCEKDKMTLMLWEKWCANPLQPLGF